MLKARDLEDVVMIPHENRMSKLVRSMAKFLAFDSAVQTRYGQAFRMRADLVLVVQWCTCCQCQSLARHCIFFQVSKSSLLNCSSEIQDRAGADSRPAVVSPTSSSLLTGCGSHIRGFEKCSNRRMEIFEKMRLLKRPIQKVPLRLRDE